MPSVCGIAGGMTNGIVYFGIVVGSREPPAMAAKAFAGFHPRGKSRPAPMVELNFRSSRLVSMSDSFSGDVEAIFRNFPELLVPKGGSDQQRGCQTHADRHA